MTADTVLGILGSAATLGVLFEMLRRRRLREKYAVFWGLVALLTLIVAGFPGVLTFFAELVGVAVPANLLFFVASMTLMVISVQHSWELGRLEDRSRTLAEEVAFLSLRLDQLSEDEGLDR